MTITEIQIGTQIQIGTEIQIATVSWEPCSEFHDDVETAHGCCAGCGWAPDEHDVELPAAA
jgi:hypothetical protein